MQFTSLLFGVFLAISMLLYYVFSKNVNLQNAILIGAGMCFYGLGHPQYVLVWFIVSGVTFVAGIATARWNQHRNLITTLSIGFIVSLFIVLKYAGMLWQTFTTMPSSLQSCIDFWLPIGLSFYSFTCIGYILDIHKQRISVCTNPLQFFAYGGFFPQLLSGPISFADKQLPQFAAARKWNKTNVVDALPVFAWGLFKKVVIANTLSKPVAYIFAQHEHLNSYTLTLGLFLYSIQVYADFSGYSDMAYALGKSFQINLPNNFRMPYFSSNIAEYWRRWHSSLSTWLGRYIYFPLGGNQQGWFKQIRNVVIVFLVSGWWHGADWKFVFWGFLNGLFYILYLLNDRIRLRFTQPDYQSMVKAGLNVSGMVLTFVAVSFARVYFRSNSFSQANDYITCWWNHTSVQGTSFLFGWQALLVSALFLSFEWLRKDSKAVLDLRDKHPLLQSAVYVFTLACIVYAMHEPQTTEHIYFKF